MKRGKGVLYVLGVRASIGLRQVVSRVGHVVPCPVRGLGQFLTSIGEEDVAEDDAADGWVRIRINPRAVRTCARRQLGFVEYAIGRTPDRPSLADPQLDVFVEEAAANQRIPRDVDGAKLLGVLGLEEEWLAGARALKP